MREKKIIIIGAGLAGIEAAINLSLKGHEVTIVEKESNIGGNISRWDHLFPTLRPASDILDYLESSLKSSSANVLMNTKVEKLSVNANHHEVLLENGQLLKADAVLIATGYQLFNASKKEEYGYGIYDNVITSADLEQKFKEGKALTMSNGKEPKRIGFIHCVGSRDEKVGNTYCSKVCCITGVKQAIELRMKLPRTEILCFYMDLRMFGKGYEELYKEAQEKYAIQFIRGRLSEAAENIDTSLQIKAEDTLSGRPLKMTVDLLVLLVGMVPSETTKKLAKMLNIKSDSNDFIKVKDEYISNNETGIQGVFVAGATTSPMSISDTFADARAAAIKIEQYLNNLK